MGLETKTILVTGAGGLLGFHVTALLLAKNGEREFQDKPPAYNIRTANTADFSNDNRLSELVNGCDLVLHLAGVNRAKPEVVEEANESIGRNLVRALSSTLSKAHVVFANTTHASSDTPYGRGKSAGRDAIRDWAVEGEGAFTDVILPHLFGEKGVANYNTVTATLCEHVLNGTMPEIHDGAQVELLHAGDAAVIMLEAGLTNQDDSIRAKGVPITVQDLYDQILSCKEHLESDLFPDFSNKLTLQLYNTYRFAAFSENASTELVLRVDARGELFEASRGGGGGQTFLSWTKPGIERGNHFHRRKVERFVVVEGQADIKLRRVFDDKIFTFSVSGDQPVAVDIPTLFAHSIINTGEKPLLTLFWAHEIFDPNDTDTFMHFVNQTSSNS